MVMDAQETLWDAGLKHLPEERFEVIEVALSPAHHLVSVGSGAGANFISSMSYAGCIRASPPTMTCWYPFRWHSALDGLHPTPATSAYIYGMCPEFFNTLLTFAGFYAAVPGKDRHG